MINRYLEKVASLVKLAWDSEYDHDGEYGVSANRSILEPNVHHILMKASKDPNVSVHVYHKSGESANSLKDPEKFKSIMGKIRSELGPEKSVRHHYDNMTMDWNSDHSWSMGMKKDSPAIKKYIGEENEDGDVMDSSGAVMHYLNKKHPH